MVGYRFAANADLLVTALGAYDFGLDGISGGAAVERVAEVPEPASLALVLTGIGVAGLLRRRRH